MYLQKLIIKLVYQIFSLTIPALLLETTGSALILELSSKFIKRKTHHLTKQISMARKEEIFHIFVINPILCKPKENT